MAAGKSLNVVQRERFFDDSFFRETWDDFDRAVQTVLDKFDNRGLKVDDGSRSQCRDVYSQIRSSKINEDPYASQAVQINEKDGRFHVVMDVKDFNPRDLQVKAVDDRIVVEGSYQKVSLDGSSTSTNSFYKEFSLPAAADIDHVTTALSKDGVLTIKAPKKEGAAIAEGPKLNNSSSNVQQSSFSQHSDNNSNSAFSKSSKRVVQSSSSFENSSLNGLEALPKEMREKLMFSDSGFASAKSSACTSPAPSEAGSESSRVSSTMEFDLNNRNPVRSEVTFNVSSPSQPTPQPMYTHGFPAMSQQPQYQPQYQQQPQQAFQQPRQNFQQQSPQIFQQMPRDMAQQFPYQQQQQPCSNMTTHQPSSAGPGTGNQTSVSVTEENGRRVMTSQTSNVVQEKDGLMEHRETAAEITDKNSQAARREASTKMARHEEDPEGKFKRSEKADAAEVSESCVQQMPDGSVMSVKKSSSSTSSVKQSFSSSMGGPEPFLQHSDFPSAFGDLRNLMGRGHSLMSQMSTDSMASTMSGRSGFSDMSNFSRFSDASSQFSEMSNFSNMSSFSNMSQMPHISDMPGFGNMSPMDNAPRVNRSFSSSSSSSVNKSSFSNFGDRNF